MLILNLALQLFLLQSVFLVFVVSFLVIVTFIVVVGLQGLQENFEVAVSTRQLRHWNKPLPHLFKLVRFH